MRRAALCRGTVQLVRWRAKVHYLAQIIERDARLFGGYRYNLVMMMIMMTVRMRLSMFKSQLGRKDVSV